MSGTTITAEERAQWLSEAQPKNIDYYEPIDFELDKRIRKLIGALEQAEARADFADNVLEAARDCILSGDPTSDVGLFLECDEFDKKLLVDIAALRTRAECAESTQPNLFQWLSDIAVELGCDCDNEAMLLAVNGLKVRAEKAEAENEQLTKERDWLAAKLSDCPPEFTNCAVDCAECRKEAASRAVAAGEEPCQK